MTAITETVWLITGCSTGFGREIANCALQQGARVAVTARRSVRTGRSDGVLEGRAIR